jgi:hypothetical protein
MSAMLAMTKTPAVAPVSVDLAGGSLTSMTIIRAILALLGSLLGMLLGGSRRSAGRGFRFSANQNRNIGNVGNDKDSGGGASFG